MAAEVKSLTAGAAESGAVARGPNLPQAVPTPAKTYLVTLPRELILEIIKLCVPPRPLRNTITMNRTITVSQLSLVDKSLREMCIPTLFRTLKLRTGQHELLGHIQVLEDSRVLEVVQCVPGHSPNHLNLNEMHFDVDNTDSSPALNMARFWHPLAEDQDENMREILGECPELEVLYFQITRFHASRYTPVRDDAGMFVRSQCVVFADWPEISEELRGE